MIIEGIYHSHYGLLTTLVDNLHKGAVRNQMILIYTYYVLHETHCSEASMKEKYIHDRPISFTGWWLNHL